MEILMRDSLLKEAVADAKAIHSAAVANAKLSLEESFRPHLANMLSARLRNEVEGLTEDNDASSEIGSNGVTVDDPAPKEPSKASSDSSHIQNPGQEIEPLGEGLDEDLADGDEGTADPSFDPTLAPAPEGNGEGGYADDVSGIGGSEDGDDADDLDLDAIIRELEADIQNSGNGGNGEYHAPMAQTAPTPAIDSDDH